MSRRARWTHGQDTQIRRRRVEAASWETIATELVLPLAVVIARGRQLGLPAPRPSAAGPAEDPMRDPLPAGHPASWDAINAGTVLRGVAYPLLFFRR